MKTSSSFGSLALGAALLGSTACGTQFDTIDQLDGLRVMAIQKDKPYARPGETVELDILYHYTGDRKPGEAEGKPRDISVAWLSGCTNPPADLYAGCLQAFQGALGDMTNAGKLGIGMEEHFSFRVPQDVISKHPESPDATQAPHGVNYVFFAACAGTLTLDSKGEFPMKCADPKGKVLGAHDFVAGYTAIYSYADYSNSNPAILGLEINGKAVPSERLCIGVDCGALPPDPERKCDPDDPVIERCADADDITTCKGLPLHLSVDPKSVDVDESLSVRKNSDVNEQMWANFHTDRGKFKFDVALVNDLNAGFNKNPDTEYYAPANAGPAQIWAVVRDNRAGVQWVRTQVCVTD